MEANIFVPIATSEGQLKLNKMVLQQYRSSYFDVMETSKNGVICLVSNKKMQMNKNKQNIISRIDECSKCLSEADKDNKLCFKKYYQKISIDVENKPKLILIYKGLQTSKCLIDLNKKLDDNKIIDLGIFLVRILVKIKQVSGYFGGFNPYRIFYTGDSKFCIIGGQFYNKKLTSKQFITKNESLKNDLSSDWKYQPPQLYDRDGVLNYSSDLFVVSCILYEIITGNYPFHSKQAFISKQIPSQYNYSQITKYLCTKVLQPNPWNTRAQPQQFLQILESQRAKVLFGVFKNNIEKPNKNISSRSASFSQFHQSIVKSNTQIEGMVSYFCQNDSENVQKKQLQQILLKISNKKQNISKLVLILEKYSEASFIQQNGIKPLQDKTYSLIKVGVLIFSLIRKIPLYVTQFHFSVFSKICLQIVKKSPTNIFLTILFKTIGFKVTAHTKFSQFTGNFHLKIEQYLKLGVEALEFLSQYCLKVLIYLTSLIGQKKLDDAKFIEKTVVMNLCDELYDTVSIILYCLMSMRKDKILKIAYRSNIPQENFKKLDTSCIQILIQINKLCVSNQLFSSHQIHLIKSDYYEYQQDLHLIFAPVATSYEYFYQDKHQYKGLCLPKDYSKIYAQQSNKEKEIIDFSNRKPILNQIGNLQIPSIFLLNKNKVEIKRQEFGSDKQEKSSKQQNLTHIKSHTQFLGKAQSSPIKQQQKKQVFSANDFSAFTLNIKSAKPQTELSSLSNASKLTNTTQTSKNDQSSPSMEEMWYQTDIGDLMSYEWLKKTEKLVNSQFIKPQLDSVIYEIFDDLSNNLKLQQLIKLLDKSKKVIIDPNQVLFHKIIGVGNAGQVYIGRFQQKIVAIKKVRLSSNPNALKQFEREVLTYLKINSHPNLVSLKGLTKYNHDYFLLTQFCQGGSLFDLLHKKVNQIALSWKERISIALDIAKGIYFLHYMSPPVIHRDIKSLNVLMTKRHGIWSAKVADFGLSRTHQAGMMTGALGTLHWMAPELLSNKPYTLKIDVYSFGVLLWQICTRKTPYLSITNQMDILKFVVNQKGRPSIESINQGCPQQLIELMKRCWSQQPQDRPQFAQIVEAISKIPA